MRLGLGPIDLDGLTRAALDSLATHGVRASFDAIWLAEARVAGAGGGLAAAAMLAQTVPVRAGAVVDAGMYHPLHLAEDIAVADLTASGRIEVLLRFPKVQPAGYVAPVEPDWFEEFLHVLTTALSGAHLGWNGKHLRVPGGLEANQPVPDRLALNPRPAQPVVPIWVEPTDRRMETLARELGFGIAARWAAGAKVPAATGRWPGLLLCRAGVEAKDLLAAAAEGAGYFLVAAHDGLEVEAAGRRLVGPLRMPDFPEWVNHDE